MIKILQRLFQHEGVRRILLVFGVTITLIFNSNLAFAWPTDAQWIPLFKGGDLLQDDVADSQGSRNVVSDPNNDAAFMYNDGLYIYFRLRLDESPAGTGGQGILKSFGWGVEIDTNLSSGDYEWLIMVDGVAKTEVIELQQNTIQATVGDPGDSTESVCASVPVSGNHQILTANTAINGDQDYFLDWRFPYSTFKQCTGLTDSSPLRLFFGSSSSTNSLTESGADLLGASDLIAGFSDYVTPFGTLPTTGVVKFVSDLLGSSDVTLVTAGQTIYVRVEDADQNYNNAVQQTLTVSLTTTGGDSETLTLIETGVDTGFFSAAIPSFNGPPTSGNGTIEVTAPDEIVTATYIDGIDASLQQNQVRTDTLTVLLPPLLSVGKTVTPASTAAGGIITYTITITNSGQGEGFLTQVKDILPAGFTHVPTSTSGLTTDDPVINGQVLTWTGNWTIPRKTGGVDGTLTLAFQATAGSTSGTHYNNVTVSGSNFALASTGDTAPVTVTAPLMSLTKSADPATGKPGDEIIYAVHFRNLGDGESHTLIIMDTVPLFTTFVSGSLQLGAAGAAYDDPGNTLLTDGSGDDAGEISGNNIIFNINYVAPDDGVPDSGPDEGVVYFKVRID